VGNVKQQYHLCSCSHAGYRANLLPPGSCSQQNQEWKRRKGEGCREGEGEGREGRVRRSAARPKDPVDDQVSRTH